MNGAYVMVLAFGNDDEGHAREPAAQLGLTKHTKESEYVPKTVDLKTSFETAAGAAQDVNTVEGKELSKRMLVMAERDNYAINSGDENFHVHACLADISA